MIPEHRAAISLNNAGVSLFEKGCYTQGVRTFCDAVAVMNIALTCCIRGSNDLSDEAIHNANEIESILIEASYRLACPEPDTLLAAAGEENRGSSTVFDVRIISQDHDPRVIQEERSVQSLSSGDCHNEPAYLVRLSASSSANERNQTTASTANSRKVQASLILQNLGVSYRCMVHVTSDKATQRELKISAEHIFTSSCSILSNICQSYNNSGKVAGCSSMLILATTLSLHNSFSQRQRPGAAEGATPLNALSTSSRSSDWKKYRNQVDFLRNQVSSTGV